MSCGQLADLARAFLVLSSFDAVTRFSVDFVGALCASGVGVMEVSAQRIGVFDLGAVTIASGIWVSAKMSFVWTLYSLVLGCVHVGSVT